MYVKKNSVQTVKMATDRNDKVTINFAWQKLLSSYLLCIWETEYPRLDERWGCEQWRSYTQASLGLCPHKIYWCPGESNVESWSQVSCGREASIQLNEWYLWPKAASQAISEWEHAPDFLADTCYVRNGCAHGGPCNLLIRLRHRGMRNLL